MNYELVIKFWRQPLPDEASMAAIASELKSLLRDTAQLDGHDAKGGEINLFILTDDPKHTFRRVKKVLESKRIDAGYAAASRLVGGSQFTSIWPPRAMKKFKIP